MKIDVDKMVEAAEGVSTVLGLVVHLTELGIPVAERTLYRWKEGTFNKGKVESAAKAVNLEMKDIVIM